MARLAPALGERDRAPSGQPSAKRRFVTDDGVALHVRDHGPAGSPVTVVLMHGWTCDHTVWDRIVGLLPAGSDSASDGARTSAVPDSASDGARTSAAVRVLRYDHRGHGGSGPATAGTATIDRLAEDAAELIAARVPHGKLVLVGHSMGGMTMMALAERFPELVRSRVASAVFVSTTPRSIARMTLGLRGPLGTAAIRGENAVTVALGRARREHFLRRPAVLRPFVRRLVFGSGASRRDVAALARQVGRVHPASMSGFRQSFRTHERRVALARFAGIPCTVLVGTRDGLTPVSHARLIAEELPDAEFVRYPGAGHMLPYERAEELAARITGHLSVAVGG
ncbi:MAG: alpha/beta fold hydrolase [Pseudonocardiaceae bacterium]|nr:alpha/beta fold hydrolase [Pseudonocardiaceae bacterium]